ncbi:MAG: hypothetical protein ABIH37_02890 [archaeon]
MSIEDLRFQLAVRELGPFKKFLMADGTWVPITERVGPYCEKGGCFCDQTYEEHECVQCSYNN